ncbi:MAG: YbhB/YbcL family Raf kinase inhibitor-like protein [Nitrosopumilus sp. (ex Thoosa mismalolli)]|nr:YbhB/YbcL family Raf kinase inhibitor-like protein [Nitrosopumilus sp. (ex Thoosa mismalolli)]
MTTLSLKSSAFENGEEIPKKYGYKNGNVSPPLTIYDVPQNTVSLALIMDDPDAMAAVGKVWVHWVVCNIEPNSNFDENSIPSSCIEGQNDFGEIGYGGPAPPDKEHTYIFKLFALDTKLDVSNKITKIELEKIIKNHILAETKLEGRYSP